MIRHWPIAASIVLLWLAVAVLVGISLARTDQHLVYPLDDTYITMAIAKNVAHHGTWGVTRYEFASSSSSILWPIVLATTYLISGTNEMAPLLWNLLFATLLVGLCGVHLRARGWPPVRVFLALLGIVVLTPLPVLVFIGLEHTLQVLLTIAIAARGAAELGEDRGARAGFPSAWLLALAALLVGTRYEGLFLVGVLCLLWAALKGWRGSVALAAAAAVPVVVYGMFSLIHGWRFFPNSILLKTSLTQAVKPIVQQGLFSAAGIEGLLDLLGYGAYERFMRAAGVLFLLVLGLALELCRTQDRWSRARRGPVLLALFAGTSVLHMQFADVGWLYRYEAYLIALGFFVLCVEASESPAWSVVRSERHTLAGLLFVALLAMCALGNRAAQAATLAPRAARNIYTLQYQMGLFLREHFQGARITVSDVGAVNFLADIRSVDIDGLASREAFDLKLAGGLTRDAIASMGRGSSVAILYPHALAERGLPDNWTVVGSWTIPDNVICSSDTVYFYAPDGSDPGDLSTKLRSFGSRLPFDVGQVFAGSREEPAPLDPANGQAPSGGAPESPR